VSPFSAFIAGVLTMSSDGFDIFLDNGMQLANRFWRSVLPVIAVVKTFWTVEDTNAVVSTPATCSFSTRNSTRNLMFSTR
jgi:hypothetical protein